MINERKLSFNSHEQNRIENKEKISFDDYVGLRYKEFHKEIKTEEFTQMLAYEFDIYSDITKEIEGKFSPEEEIREILKLPREEKKEALNLFKEKLIQQREAWANCRIFIERSILHNHDTSKEDLLQWVEKFGNRYGFTEKQKQTAEQIIDNYKKKRAEVIEFREMFPDDLNLIKELTGTELEDYSEIDISLGPASIDIKTNSVNTMEKIMQVKNINNNYCTDGFCAKSKNYPSIWFTVINNEHNAETEKANIHEQEHIKNIILQDIFTKNISNEKADYLEDLAGQEKDPVIRQRLFESYYRYIREDGLNRAKNEIIAFNKERSSFLINPEMFLNDSEYNYFREILKEETTVEQSIAKNNVLVKEYGNILQNALKAYDKLKEIGYTNDEVIAILADKSLTQWPKTARLMTVKHK